MTEIERLAKVLAGALLWERPDDDDMRGPCGAEEAVRAILKAMREPSDETEAAGNVPLDWGPATEVPASKVWQAMIDHILAEPS